MKKILVLGGTMFVGRALVEKLLTLSQFDVTLFNRGKSNANLFPNTRQIFGNRETEDIMEICKEDWDVVIDFSGYYPLSFQKLLAALGGKVGRYIFISTISVYDLEKFAGESIAVTAETLCCTAIQKTSKLPDAYGEKKAEMERILLQQEGLDKIILRPSFIYGQYDWTDRFYYWLYRTKFARSFILPDDFNLSLTYAADLVNGIITAIQTENHVSIYNTISQRQISLRGLVSTAAAIFEKDISLVAAASVAISENVTFPLFVPFNFTVEGEHWLRDFSVSPTPFVDAIAKTIQYHDSVGWHKPKVGWSLEEESACLGV